MKKFEQQCRSISDTLGIDVEFYYNEPGNQCYVDDGFLHIHKSGMRAAFSVDTSQDNGTLQNQHTRAILMALGMDSKITDRVLVEENDEDEDVCEWCQRPY